MQSWKGCVGAIPPWVRIPSPLYTAEWTFVLFRRIVVFFLSSLIITFFQDFWLEGFHVIVRAKVRSNPAFADFKRSEFGLV